MRRWPPHRADWAFGEDRPSQLWFQRGIQASSINRSCFLFLADIVARFHRFNWPQRGKNRNLQNLLVLTAIKADKPSSQPVMRGSGYLMIWSCEDEHPSKWDSIDSNTSHRNNSRFKFRDICCTTSLFPDSRRTPMPSKLEMHQSLLSKLVLPDAW